MSGPGLTHRPLTAAIMCLALAGCGSLFGPSAPVSYYSLTPAATGDAALPSMGRGIIAVQTVRLPDYLNQNGIVTRSDANALNIARDSQWAGSLSDNITNVVVTNLSRLLATTRVVAYPVSAALPVDRVVQVDISQFEAIPGGRVVLNGQWTIFADGGRTFLTTDSGAYATSASGTGYAEIAEAMSQVLGSFSHDIAVALVATGQGSPKPTTTPNP